MLGYESGVVRVDARVLGSFRVIFHRYIVFSAMEGSSACPSWSPCSRKGRGREAFVTSTLAGRTKAQTSNTTLKSSFLKAGTI